jgi:hypothetical protein
MYEKKPTSATGSAPAAAVLTRLDRHMAVIRNPATDQNSYLCRFHLIVQPGYVLEGLPASWRQELVGGARAPQQLGDFVVASLDCHSKRGLRVCTRA